MNSNGKPRLNYTHTTNLTDPRTAHVSIQSTTLPLALRTVTPNDASALLAIFSNPANTTHDPSALNLNTLPAIQKVIASWTNITTPLTRLNFIIVADGEVVGVSGMGHISTQDDGKRVGDAGVMVNPNARGQGYAYESLRMTIDHALRVLGLDEVTVQMGEANVGMRGLMVRKFGVAPTTAENGDECCYRFGREGWLGEK